ncbi:MAG: nitrate/sulfonate/bicarbonate ABC transporter ATP-binding protein [Hyphomicrobiales bacterium]|nr:MAG: nitrate/sulfonate/bicarbonate ABC transporter ATP-binding protein [Hyphomicrobiales bacterium]
MNTAPTTAANKVSAAPAVKLDGIGKTFANGTTALRDVSLTVREGEFLSLLGPSGCGKTTILRLISGLADPTEGTLSGNDIGARRRGDIGYVFQEPTLMPWATVFNNVWLPFRLRGASKAEARNTVMEALERVGLADFAEAFPRELSGGMKMRVSIARALVTRPRLLLMDEPFAALDEITRFKLNDDLIELWREAGWTVIFVTHSVFESVYLSNRIAVMTSNPGRIAGEIGIDAPYPRGPEFRTSAVYNEYCRVASDMLRLAMTAGNGA